MKKFFIGVIILLIVIALGLAFGSQDNPIETSRLEVGAHESDVNGLKAELEFMGVEDLPELE